MASAHNDSLPVHGVELTGRFPVRPAYTHDVHQKQYRIELSKVQQADDQINREIGLGLPRNVKLNPRDSLWTSGSDPPAYHQQCDLVSGAYQTYPRAADHQHYCSLQYSTQSGGVMAGGNGNGRRQSVTSHASHKSEPPSYEMATNSDYRCLSPPEINTTTSRACPLCQQSPVITLVGV